MMKVRIHLVFGEEQQPVVGMMKIMAELREQAAESVVAAVADLEEVGRIKAGAVDVGSYFPKGTSNLIRDSRDPKVIDEMLTVALFENTNGETITTLSHFGNHPEAMADENTMITSDFPDKLRVEEGSIGSLIHVKVTAVLPFMFRER